MLLLSCVVFAGTWGLPYWSDYAPGPGFLAVWIAGLGVLLSVLLLTRKNRADSAPIEIDTPEPDLAAEAGGVRRVVTTIIALFATLVGMPLIGLRATTAAFMLFMLLIVLRRNWISSVAATAITVAIVHVVFVHWLQIDIAGSLFAAPVQ
jgi:hypothetical protein